MKRKGILAVMLSVVMLGGLLSGCGYQKEKKRRKSQ